MSASRGVPIKYKSTVKKLDILYTNVQCTSFSGMIVKEEVSKYLDKESMEHYLVCIKTADMIDKRYTWWTTAANGTALAFQTINQMLLDSLLETWEDKCTTMQT
eukprot:12475432-Ditylum_brightwellii.AAC.1